jgi:steroid delta-isomerase
MNRPADMAEAYIRFYETMTPESLARLPDLATPEIHFVDPFNDVTGIEPMRRILAKMFADLAEPRFVVTHRAWDGDVCFLRWRFTARGKAGGAAWIIEGMSELHFAADGKVASHVDYWDSGRQFYEKLPLLGSVLRLIRRRLAAG